jgi:hypothetical protein
MANGALVHKHCHPKGSAAEVFARKWAVLRNMPLQAQTGSSSGVEDDPDDDEV